MTLKLGLNRLQASIQLTITISGRRLVIWAFQFLNACLDCLLGGIGFSRPLGDPGVVLVVDFDKYILRSYMILLFAGFSNGMCAAKMVNSQLSLNYRLVANRAVGHF